MLYDNMAVNAAGHLIFAGLDTVSLAERYVTPLYLTDEGKIRENLHVFKNAIANYFPCGSAVYYAGKAFCCRAMYRILKDEEVGADVVSAGEIYTAATSGFSMERCIFHGNNKTDSDIKYALDSGIGYFAADNEDELFCLDKMAGERGRVQKILLRITPGIDPHTHKKITTGTYNSKFGFYYEGGQALKAAVTALSLKNISLCGFHCHIGSQIFAAAPFVAAVEKMLAFIKEVKEKTGYTAEILDIGGGFGVKYTDGDMQPDIDAMLKNIAAVIKSRCEEMKIAAPKILIEPGRSIAANAGLTLYTVGSVKKTPGGGTFVSVDGGMTDNPRYTLYGAPYTVIAAGKAEEKLSLKATVAGRCCESGDIIQENVMLPEVCRGDILAVAGTGAYNYSMASNYNRIPRPPVVMLYKGQDYTAIRREEFKDICRCDI